MEKKNTMYGLGRRTTAIARVNLTKKKEEIKINGKKFEDYFPTVAMQNVILRPLELTSKVDDFGFVAKVRGGGMQSQAEAVQLGIARALVDIDEDYRTQLKQAGVLTRDSRKKERKKPGLRGARRAPQFSKR